MRTILLMWLQEAPTADCENHQAVSGENPIHIKGIAANVAAHSVCIRRSTNVAHFLKMMHM